MSDYPMLISNKLHSFRNFIVQGTYFKISALYFSQKMILDFQQLTKANF